MSESKRRRFIYKKATFLTETGDSNWTLEKLVKSAVKNVPKALERAQNPDGTDYRFLNYSGPHIVSESPTGLYGCEFLGFEKGADQSTIKIDPNATEVDVDHIIADGNEEFLAGSIYFGIAGNHVVMVQSSALRSKDLENYLNWLLVEKSKVLSSDNRVALIDHVPKSKNVKGVKGIEIGAPIQFQPSGAAPTGGFQADKEFPLLFGGKAWEVIKTIFAEGFDLPTELNVKNITDAPNLEVKVFLKWKASHGEDDVDFLNSIAKNLSHTDEFDYRVHTKTGTITRSDFKLEQYYQFKWNNGRPQFDDLFPRMATWLAELVNSGKVEV